MNGLSYRDERAVHLFVVLVGGGLAIWTLVASPFSDKANLYIPLLSASYALVAIFRLRRAAADREDTELFERVDKLEQTDPAQADRLIDAYLDQKATLAQQQRAELWAMATSDRRAALRLQRLLREELSGHDLMRQRVIPTLSPEERTSALRMVQEKEERAREDLARVEALVKQLKSP